jgi:tetratricopeptide (TPR) repeat protein
MSPEQALAKRVPIDHRTDVYSLGASFYELLTLRPAFGGSDRQEMLRQIAFEEPVQPRRIDKAIPAELETIALKALEKNPADRYGTAQELADDLRRFLEDRPIQARRATLPQRLRKWGRRHQAAVMAAAACLLVTLVAVVGSVGWVLGDRAARRRETEVKVCEALEAAGPGLRQGNPYAPALIAAVQRAKALRDAGLVDPELRGRVEQLLRDLEMLTRLDQARLKCMSPGKIEMNYEGADLLYAEAFNEYGVDVFPSPPGEAAERVRTSAIRTHLVAALDDWAGVRDELVSERARVLSAARSDIGPYAKNQLYLGAGTPVRSVVDLADEDRWRQRLRGAERKQDFDTLEDLAQEEEALSQPPANLVLLARTLGGERASRKASAERLLRKALLVYPEDFWINYELARAIRGQQPRDGAESVRFYQAAIALRPQSPELYAQLASVLRSQGKLAETVAAFQKAVELQPDALGLYDQLGDALQDQLNFVAAEAAYRKIIELRPNYAVEAPSAGGLLYCKLGEVIQQQGHFAEALAALERGHELGSKTPGWGYPSARLIRDAKQLVALDAKLPEFLSGEAQPANAAEEFALAQVCRLRRKLYAAAARFYAGAFAAQPPLANGWVSQDCCNAARAAALAGCGKGNDAANLSDSERAGLRQQALDWLRAVLDDRRRRLATEPPRLPPFFVIEEMQRWLAESDFAGVRGPKPLAGLPETERRAWRKLWSDVAETLIQARRKNLLG